MPQVDYPESVKNTRSGLKERYPTPFVNINLDTTTAVYELDFTVREFEAARIRVALINGCSVCMSFRRGRDPSMPLADLPEDLPGDDFYEEILNWRTATLFSDRERLAIEFAERFALDHLSLDHDEDFWKRMHDQFSDREIVELSLAIGHFIGVGRTIHVLGLDSACPVPRSMLPA